MADERRGKAFDVTPEEARFLHRFVRRTMLPWILGVGALAGLALGVASSPPLPALGVAAEAGVHASAAEDELRAELASLRDELAAFRSAAGEKAQPGDRDAQRLRDELEPRLAKIEAALATRPALVSQEAAGVPAAASPEELITIRDRLYDLERSVSTARLGRLEDSEQRIERLELRLSALEGLPAAPAAPAPDVSPQ